MTDTPRVSLTETQHYEILLEDCQGPPERIRLYPPGTFSERDPDDTRQPYLMYGDNNELWTVVPIAGNRWTIRR